MNVSANLLDYLKSHDKAELIGIGTFYAKNTPAELSPITNTFNPPKRELTFSNEQNKDMGFVQSIAKSEFISEETALKWVTQYSDSIKEKLNTLGECKVGQLGLLKKATLSGYDFAQQEGLNLLATSFAFSSLKNVKTFDKGDYIDTIKTKEPLKPIVPTPETEQKPIAQTQSAKPLESIVIATAAQKEQSAGSMQEHEASVMDYINKSEEKPKEETLNVQQDEEKNISFQEKEAIKEDSNQIEENQKEVQRRLDELNSKWDSDENSNSQNDDEEKSEKESKHHHHHKMPKREKAFWRVIFIILLVLILLCGFVVFAHYMCWLKKCPQFKTISAKLNTYITPRCDKTLPAKTAVVTPTQTATETPVEEVVTPTTQAQNEYTVAPVPKEKQSAKQSVKQPKTTAKPSSAISTTKEQTVTKKATKTNTAKAKKATKATKATKAKKAKVSGEKDNPPQPTAQIDYTTPIMMQSVSRLGFDVVGTTATNRSTAEQSARVARSQGYDSYIISKNGKYYVSYGSRRTSGEANVFMKQISKRSGDKGFYIISR